MCSCQSEISSHSAIPGSRGWKQKRPSYRELAHVHLNVSNPGLRGALFECFVSLSQKTSAYTHDSQATVQSTKYVKGVYSMYGSNDGSILM